MHYFHKPVLLQETTQTFDYLCKLKKPFFVDGTVGLGGHSSAIAGMLRGKPYHIVGIDKDRSALEMSRKRFDKDTVSGNCALIHEDFNNFRNALDELEIDKVDGILLDLGVSSMQLDNKGRGFSFNEPEASLDMRMDQSQSLDAKYIVNFYSQAELERILKQGEEQHWRKVARKICEARTQQPINTIADLISVLAKALPSSRKKTHFATDTFRALRLETNNEIATLAETINSMVDSLNEGGRLAVITFHSLEDRIIKNEFRRLGQPCTCPSKVPHCVCGLKPKIKHITKKPVSPSPQELAENPRSRSAKLRVVEKVCSQ